MSIGKNTFVQIIAYDKDRENAVKEERVRRIQQRIWKQTGFRWVAEALAGGDLSDLDPGCFMGIMSNSAAAQPKYPLKEFSDRLKQRLKDHRPVLVGHNLFTDLVNFCRCFFGPLPESVEDFQTMVHEMFPMLMDTKYMATHDCGSINPKSSLSEINSSLARIAIPEIGEQTYIQNVEGRLTSWLEIQPHHSKYNTQEINHEAGYDSLLTAQVFIKLSAQLRDGGVSKQPGKSSLTPARSQIVEDIRLGGGRGKPTQPRVSDNDLKTTVPSANNGTPRTLPADLKPIVHGSSEGSSKLRGYRTRFDLLEVQESSEVPEDTPPEEAKVSLRSDGSEDVALKVRNGELIPRLDAEFWKVYGNRLRVFGTEERVCIIESKPPQISRQLATVNLLAE